MLRMFCVPFSGPKFRLVLFWNGRLIRLPTGFCASLASSSALIAAYAGDTANAASAKAATARSVDLRCIAVIGSRASSRRRLAGRPVLARTLATVTLGSRGSRRHPGGHLAGYVAAPTAGATANGAVSKRWSRPAIERTAAAKTQRMVRRVIVFILQVTQGVATHALMAVLPCSSAAPYRASAAHRRSADRRARSAPRARRRTQ